MTESPDDHCARELRRLDPDRWLSALFAPDDRRAGLFALYMFNSEIARARESVTQPMIGQIRLQWWREAWEGIRAGTPRQHPVVLALHAHGRHLDAAQVLALIDARERDMEEQAPTDLAALLAYAEATSAPLMRLAAQLLGADLDERILRPAATAYALTGILRATPYLIAQRRILLPANLLGAHGLTADAVLQTDVTARLPAVIAEIAAEAARLLDEARHYKPSRKALPALLPAALTGLHLRALARSGYEPAMAEARVTPLARQMTLLWASLRGRL
jgi:NADH dehydrogenase [ubiquinone] 1 alpha subcomplex assembly factor 6